MKALRSKQVFQEPIPFKHSFFKGCHYENMKGAYEVLSIEGARMRIRWESGEESETEVELQDRILSRIEREVRAAKARPGDQKEVPEYYFGERFQGLVPADFSSDVAKTAWRSRTGGLGSAVIQELDSGGFCFGFWVPFRKPMIHWSDVDQKIRSAAVLKAGFFCRLDESNAYYGFFLDHSSDADETREWRRFLDWLSIPEHEVWLRSVAEEKGLRIFDPETASFPGFLQVSSAQWVWVEEGRRTDVPSLGAFLAALPAETAVVECAARIEKDNAVRRTAKLGRDIALLIQALLPLYRAALGEGAEKKPSGPARRRAE